MAKVNLWLEMEIGITGGEEDGVDNTGVKAEELYTKPEQVSWGHLVTAEESSGLVTLGGKDQKWAENAKIYILKIALFTFRPL